MAGASMALGQSFTPVPSAPASIVPVPLPVFGPESTQANRGYESANVISPVVPSSYTAYVSPRNIGLQFLGDAPAHLRRDGLRVSVSGPHGTDVHGPAVVGADGFAGLNLTRPLAPGVYTVRLASPGFARNATTWQLQVRPLSHGRMASIRKAVARSTRSEYLQTLNAQRSNLGEHAVHWNNSLALAAAAQAVYLWRNGYGAPSFHVESRGRADFTGTTPWARDMSFGWKSTLDGEVGIEWSQPLPAVAVVQDLIDTVYHRLSMLSPNVLAVGAGESTGATGAVVMDLGYGYRPDLPYAITYPASGQVGVPTGWTDMESPDPVPGGFSHSFGYPITVDFPTVQALSHVTVHLLLRGHVVPITEDLPGAGSMATNQMGIVPRRALQPRATYTVEVAAQAAMNNGQSSQPVRLRWDFTTGASARSVAVDPQSGRRVAVSVVMAGSGAAVPRDPVRIYEISAGSRSKLVGSGQTNSQGIAQCLVDRQAHVAKQLYEAVAGGGTSMEFWW